MSAYGPRASKLFGAIAFATISLLLIVASTEAEASLVAPRSKCDGQANVKAPEPQQEDAMRCLVNYARQHSGAGGVNANKDLERAAGRKVGDVMHCGFSHTACGKPADVYPRKFGYTNGSFQWGENLAFGKGDRGSARNILQAWLNSPPHRDTMLRGSFEHLGVGLKRGGFEGTDNAGVWVLQLDCQGC